MLQFVAVCCSVLQCVSWASVPALQCVAVRCRVLLCVTGCRNMLAMHCKLKLVSYLCCSLLQRVAVCRSLLQCAALSFGVSVSSISVPVLHFAAVRCSALQCVAVRWCHGYRYHFCIALPCFAVCCSVLQCVAVCCGALQRGAVCCNVFVSWI